MSDADAIIDMKEAIDLLGTSQPTFYRWLREGRVKGHKVGRQWRFQRSDIEALARGEGPTAELPRDYQALRQEIAKRLADCGQPVEEDGSDDLVGDLADSILLLATLMQAAAIHFDATEEGGRLRLRIDGLLHEIAAYSSDMQRQLGEHLKGAFHCNVQITDLPQDGRLRFRHQDEHIDCLLTCVPTLFGEDLVVRLLVPEQVSIQLDRLSFPEEQLEQVEQALACNHGLILVSGPTGCGKTTTLYAMLNRLNQPGRKLITIEEPVEFSLPGIQQIQARESSLPAGHALRAALRCDPDVIMLSQLSARDQVHEICDAAINGHLVISQLHCDSCISTIERLRDLEVPASVIAYALRLVVAQRLVRRLCPHCAEPASLPDEERPLVEGICHDNAIAMASLPDQWRQATGCEHCNGIGYRGRMAVYEVLPISKTVRDAIMAGADAEHLRDIQLAEGQYDLRGQALLQAAKGETTLFELIRLLGH